MGHILKNSLSRPVSATDKQCGHPIQGVTQSCLVTNSEGDFLTLPAQLPLRHIVFCVWKERCKLKAYDFHVQSDKSGISMACNFYSWKSPRLTQQDASKYVTLVDNTFTNVFWHSYLLSTQLVALFVTTAGWRKEDATIVAYIRK